MKMCNINLVPGILHNCFDKHFGCNYIVMYHWNQLQMKHACTMSVQLAKTLCGVLCRHIGVYMTQHTWRSQAIYSCVCALLC